MSNYKGQKPQPLAYGHTENGRLYMKLQGKLMEEIAYDSVIGGNLVNFAFLDEDLLSDNMLRLFGVYTSAITQGQNIELISDLLLEKMKSLFLKNTYFAIYLIGYIEVLLYGEVDLRIYTGLSGDDKQVLQMAQDEIRNDALNPWKSGLITPLCRSYEKKRRITEKTLKSIWETEQNSELFPLERYYHLERENRTFRKNWGSAFTVELGEKSRNDKTVLQLAVLETIDDMLRYEMLQLLTQGNGYKICKNCGKPFIPSGRSDAVYCSRIAPGEDKTCKQIGAYRAEKEKVSTVPAWKTYRQAYQRLNKRVEMGYMEEDAFAEWAKTAAEKRDLCLGGKLPYKDFADWIDSTSRQR